jgi:diketogulonate reductase-like aldo/keto reductase
MLNNRMEIPCIGNGPGIFKCNSKHRDNKNLIAYIFDKAYHKIYKRNRQKAKYIESIAHAIKIGFYLLDFSAAYGNEHLIKKAIKKSQIERQKLFLTTRVSNQQQKKGNIKEQLFKTLEEYGVDYVDIYMFHWPVTDVI